MMTAADDSVNKTLLKLYETLLVNDDWRKKFIAVLNPDYVKRDELKKLLDELKKQREDMNKRFEQVDKRFEESNKRYEQLREDMNKRFEQVDKRFEESNKRYDALLKKFDERTKTVDYQFSKVFERLDNLSSALGHDFEEFNSYWLETFLVEQGYPKIKIQKRTFYDENYEVFPDSKDVEIDLFNEKPLVVGEVTAIVRKIEKITTFLRKVAFIEKRYGKAKYKVFITYGVLPEIRDEAIKLLEDANIDVIILRKGKKLFE